MHGHLLDKDNLLRGHVFLLQHPFQLLQTAQRFRVLESVDDQEDVMVHHRFIGAFGEPGTRPRREAFEG
jgi:hypothetical protein